jgi:hypothetical protein
MPTKEEWIKVHADLMEKLRLPCKLRFSTHVNIGQHEFVIATGWHKIDICRIKINPEVNFQVPAHLILHEAAHHRELCCGDFHCEHWAQTLRDMYWETRTPLPQTTGFKEFAKVAGIVFRHKVIDDTADLKKFVGEGDNA